MNRRRLVSMAAILLAVAVVIQVADPAFGDQTPPPVDFTDPAAEVVADSAVRFSFVDHAYRLDIADEPSGPWEPFLVYFVDNSNRRYRSFGPTGQDGTQIYANDAAIFGRAGNDGHWRVGVLTKATYPAPEVIQPFRTEEFAGTNSSRLVDNSTWLVVRFDAILVKHVDPYPGKTTIFVNKQTELIHRAIVSYEVGEDRRRYVRFTLTDTDVDIDRPPDIPYTFQEFMGDLIQGPVFDLSPRTS